jgi:hypothetical protein
MIHHITTAVTLDITPLYYYPQADCCQWHSISITDNIYRCSNNPATDINMDYQSRVDAILKPGIRVTIDTLWKQLDRERAGTIPI